MSVGPEFTLQEVYNRVVLRQVYDAEKGEYYLDDPQVLIQLAAKRRHVEQLRQIVGDEVARKAVIEVFGENMADTLFPPAHYIDGSRAKNAEETGVCTES